jgi:TolB-like protein/class 3 adenylate cyclase
LPIGERQIEGTNHRTMEMIMAEAQLDRRMLAILAADVVGYSRLMEADEAGTIARLKAVRAEIADPLIAQHHGRLIKLMGDGALVAFESVVDAVSCAVEIQKAMAARNVSLPEAGRVVFRIGINLGDVVLVDDDIYGDGVNVAARLEQLCDPGGVIVSGTAYDQLHGKLDVTLDDAGEQQVKNIARPVRAYRVRFNGTRRRRRMRARPMRGWLVPAMALLMLIVAVSAWWLWPTSVGIGRLAVAVLPFDNYGGDEATGRLADGITEDIITDLARFRGIDVIARNSTAFYKGKPTDIRQIGKDLDVGYVLEGSIQRQADRVRVTAQLIDTRSGAHVWSDRWDRPAQDVFAVQSEVAERVGAALGTPLGLGAVAVSELQRTRRRAPTDVGAYEHYLLAAEAKSQRTPESIRVSMEHVERAIALDPGLARAYVLRGYLHFFAFTNGTADLNASLQATEADFKRAVTFDPNDAEPHSALGFYYSQIGHFAESEAEIRLSLAANPADGHVLSLAATTLPYLGYPEEAVGYADKALRLDPNMGAANLTSLKDAYYFAQRFEDTLRVVARIPVEARSRGSLLLNAASLAMLDRPRDEIDKARGAMLARDPDVSIERLLNQDWLFVRQQERELFVRGLSKAGFLLCAKSEELTKVAKPIRLPDCINS